MNIPHWFVIAWMWVCIAAGSIFTLYYICCGCSWAVREIAEHVQAYYWFLCWLYWKHGRKDRAKRELETALDIDAGRRVAVFQRLHNIEMAAQSLLIYCAVEGKDDELAMPDAERALPLIKKLNDAVCESETPSAGKGEQR